MSAEGEQVTREPNWETKNLRVAEVLGNMAVLVTGQVNGAAVAKVCMACLDVCQPLTTRRPSFSLGLSWFLFSMATVIDIWGDSYAGSPQIKFACIVCFLMLCICSHYVTLGFKGQNLTQTSSKCVIVMEHGYFRES